MTFHIREALHNHNSLRVSFLLSPTGIVSDTVIVKKKFLRKCVKNVV